MPKKPRTQPDYRDQAGADRPAEDRADDVRSVSMSSEPSEADIRLRAYQIYLERGGNDGQDFDDWLRAEEELKKGI